MVITTQPRTPAHFNGMKMDEIKAWLLKHNVKLPAASRQSLFALKQMAVEKLSQLQREKISEATKQGSKQLRRSKNLGDVKGKERAQSSVSARALVSLATPSSLNLTLDDDFDVINGVRFEEDKLFKLERLSTDYLHEQELTDPFLTGSANWNQRRSSSYTHSDQLMNRVSKPSSPKPKMTRSRSPSPSRYRPTEASTSIASSMEESWMIPTLPEDQFPQSFSTQRTPHYGSSEDPERSFLSRWLAYSSARGQSFV